MWTSRRTVLSAALALLLLTVSAVAQQAGVHPISGRRYAPVMGYQGADWLDREERDIEEAPDTALDALDLTPGLVVADIGAGSGYMTVRMAKRVGATGRVYAEDIQPQMIDLMLLVDVYHEFSEPVKMLAGMRAALKTGGRLVLLEYRKEDPRVPIRLEHKMSVAEAKMEIEAAGFTLEKVDPRLPRQHILIFTKP